MTRDRTFSMELGWPALLTDFGLSPAHVLRRAGLPADLFTRGVQQLSSEDYFRFWRGIEAEAGDPMFPLRLVDAFSAEVFSPPLFAALCSSHLMQAVQRLARYKQLVAPMSLEIAVDPSGTLTLTPRWLLDPLQVPPSLQVAELAFLLRLLRLATREPAHALQVTLATLPPAGCARGYAKYFGVTVQQGSAPSIRFSAADAWRPFLTVNDGMCRVFEPDLRRRLGELDAAATTAERVRAALLELLPSGEAGIDKAAERLGLSRRTLQRRLEDEGANFRAIVHATREDLARHYLGSTTLSGGEIAFLLGFEDPNSFYRAFQDWTGQTPDNARHAMRPN